MYITCYHSTTLQFSRFLEQVMWIFTKNEWQPWIGEQLQFLFLCSGALTFSQKFPAKTTLSVSLQHPQSVKNGSRYTAQNSRPRNSVAVGGKIRRRRAMAWPQGMEPLRWMSLCVGWMVALVYLVVLFGTFASYLVGQRLDCWLAPNRTWPERSCGELWWLMDPKYLEGRFDYAKRNNLTLDYAPSSCRSIHSTDVVSNEREAQECTAWCEEHLGRGAGAPLCDWLTFESLFLGGDDAEAANIFKSCWKANLAAVADSSYIPNPWLVGVLYRFFGLLPAAILFWRGSHQARQNEDEAPPDVIPPDRLCCRDDGPFRHGNLGFPWCCRRASNDLCASRWKLRISGLGILTEPLFDAITVTTFLKNGQPFYFVVMLFGLFFSFSSSGWDGLQAQGALAFVPSWQRGFATKELLEHRNHDFYECSLSTCIQLYAAMALSWKESPLEVLQLGAFGCMSQLLSLPDTVPPRPRNFDNFYEVEDAKKKHIHTVLKYIPSVLVVFSVQCLQNLQNFMHQFTLTQRRNVVFLVGFVVSFVAYLAEGVLVLLSVFVYRAYHDRTTCKIVSVNCLLMGYAIVLFPSHVQRFMASWESFREIPWTWPLLLTWHTWYDLPWPWLEVRWDWDLMAAAMQVVLLIVGILSADIMGYREFEILYIIFAPCFWIPHELYTPT